MYILIPDEMHDWIETQIEKGRIKSPNQYVRDLIKHDQADTTINRIVLFIRLALIEEEWKGATLSVDEVIKREITKLAIKGF